MAKDTLAAILKAIGREKEDEYSLLLKKMRADYSKIINSSKLMIIRRKKDVEDIGLLSKIAAYMSIKIKIKSDNKDLLNISDMLVKR